MIPAEAVEAAAKAAYVQHSNEPGFNAAAAWDDMAGTDDWEREQWESTARAALEAAAPHMLAQKAVDAVLGISNVRMNGEHGDPAFVVGWEAALEEVQARINEATQK